MHVTYRISLSSILFSHTLARTPGRPIGILATQIRLRGFIQYLLHHSPYTKKEGSRLTRLRLDYARSKPASNAFCQRLPHRHLTSVILSQLESRRKTPSSSHSIMQLWTRPLHRPIRSLVVLCVAWKLLLLLIAVLSPGTGYDTSASLFSQSAAEARKLPLAVQYILGKLIRWDAIYFVKTAGRGYVFEQEWAFGWGFSRLISLCAAGEKLLWSQRMS